MTKSAFARFSILAAILAIALGAALAQQPELPDVGYDPRAWFASAGAWAAAIVALVALLKTHVLTSISGLGTVALSFAVGVGGAVVGSLIPWIGFDASVIEAATFGVTAAALASGGWDAVRGVITSAFGPKS